MPAPAPLPRVAAAAAAEVCGRAGLSAAALALLAPAQPPHAFLAALEDAGLAADAVRFLAFALPAREGVWWAVRVGAALGRDAVDPCYALAEDWVYEPGEERRLACLDAAERAGSDTPGAFAALGAAWSSGPMARPPAPAVLPPPRLSPTAVATSILLAVAAADPALAGRHLGDALARGLDVGRGGDGSGHPPAGALP